MLFLNLFYLYSTSLTHKYTIDSDWSAEGQRSDSHCTLFGNITLRSGDYAHFRVCDVTNLGRSSLYLNHTVNLNSKIKCVQKL